MLLYEIQKSNAKKLAVYDFSAQKEDIINYRFQQMETIPENERFFVAEDCVNIFGGIPIFVPYIKKWNNSNEILQAYYADNENRKFDNDYRGYQVLKKDNSCENDKLPLLLSYIYGSQNEETIVPIKYNENLIKYFLLTQDNYRKVREHWDNVTYWLENIIQIPESLYFLQLLEQGKFSLLKDKNISKQLELYTLSKTKECNLDDFELNDYFEIIYKAQNDAHILKRLK